MKNKMNNEQLVFIEGLIFKEKIQCYLFPINSFLCILNEILKNETKTDILKLMKNSSIIDSRILFEKYQIKKTTKINKIREFLNFVNSLGMGEINLISYSDSKIVFNIPKNILSTIYIRLYKTPPKVELENILIGYIENFLSYLLNNKFHSELKKTGNNSFIIIMTNTYSKIESIKKYDYEIVKKNLNFQILLKK